MFGKPTIQSCKLNKDPGNPEKPGAQDDPSAESQMMMHDLDSQCAVDHATPWAMMNPSSRLLEGSKMTICTE
jgi:hypothetical protein